MVHDIFAIFSDADLKSIATQAVTDFRAAMGRVLKVVQTGDLSSEREASMSQVDFMESLSFEMRRRGLLPASRNRISRTRMQIYG